MSDGYDYAIVGAGIYGLYAAKLVAAKGKRALIVECDDGPFRRASYVNQARVHNGYHYPRSYSTAIKSARYFDRFCKDFGFAINDRFRKIYAIPSRYSLTSGEQFAKFCRYANIPCDPIDPGKYFQKNTIEAAFETLEYAFDAASICTALYDHLKGTGLVDFTFNTHVDQAEKVENAYVLRLSNGTTVRAYNVINSTYAAINQVNQLFGFDKFRIKYEIAEVIRCRVSRELEDCGITVMDGPFFSVMPFGNTGFHTLTAVTFTPHKTCYGSLPRFDCQHANETCTPESLRNCNTCPARPHTSFPYMRQLAMKYLHQRYNIDYDSSLFAIKPILLASEIDDSRPTLIRSFSTEPGYTAVLSGKINTIYDMEQVIV